MATTRVCTGPFVVQFAHSQLSYIICGHCWSHHHYADDTHFTSLDLLRMLSNLWLVELQRCFMSVFDWTTQAKLDIINPSNLHL